MRKQKAEVTGEKGKTASGETVLWARIAKRSNPRPSHPLNGDINEKDRLV